MRRVALVMLILLGIPHVTGAEHLPWMEPYRDASGGSCCNDLDCVPADVLAMDPAQGIVQVDGVVLQLPPGSVHRVPDQVEQGSGWWCWRAGPPECQPPEVQKSQACGRCAFYTMRPGEG